MEKFYRGVVNHPKTILMIFTLLFLGGLICRPLVDVNYDMNKYLPKESASTIALNTMKEEFSGAIPDARIMVKDVSIPEAFSYKEKLSHIPGVNDVVWLDDSLDLKIPLELQDQSTVETYYKEKNAIFTVTIDENKRIDAVNDIQKLLGEKGAMTGSAVSMAMAMQSTTKDISKIALFAILFVFFVLIVTTTSYFEPIIIFLGIALAVVINAGSNLIFGEISFLTNAAGSILQIAVSLDYSVFLIHRFEECRKVEANPKDAMVSALCKSTSSILSSGLTTVIGFVALILMKFKIGQDLGLALAKGITINLIVVFLFMPALILATYKVFDKTKHRSFLPNFTGFGTFVTKGMLPLVGVFLLIGVPSYLASNANDFYYGSEHIFNEQTEFGKDTKEIEACFGKKATCVLLVPKGDVQKETALSEELHALPEVIDTVSYVHNVGAEIPSIYPDQDQLKKVESEHYRRMLVYLDVGSEGKQAFDMVEKLRRLTNRYYPGTYHLAGEIASTYDLMETVTTDMTRVNLIAIGAVFVVLLLTMRSLVLPVILVLAIETAIWLNLSIPYFGNQTIFYIAYLIISSVQLGATVDYAILLTERYKEFRATEEKRSAVIHTISVVSASILSSGSVLTVVGFLMGILSTHGLISQLGYFLGKGTLCSMGIVFFILPGLLYCVDGLVTGAMPAFLHKNHFERG